MQYKTAASSSLSSSSSSPQTIINIRISHFSVLAEKYSHILGCSNQQDQARWSYLQFKKFLTIEHVPRIIDFCSRMYVFGCKLSLVRLCDCDFGITPQMILLSGSLVLPFASTQHIFHSSILGTCFVCRLLFSRDFVYLGQLCLSKWCSLFSYSQKLRQVD